MPTLRVILDTVDAPDLDGVGGYSVDLTRQLIATAPRGSAVSAVVSASTEEERERLGTRLPGLAAVHATMLDRRQLAAAWQHGFTRLPGVGMVHATSPLAPLSRHEVGRAPELQTVVTIHDSLPWTDPMALSPRALRWNRAMGARAQRYADAIVVPTHAVADELGEHLQIGDRIRVVGGAARVGDGAGPADLELPERFVLTAAGSSTLNGLDSLLAALDAAGLVDLPVHVLAGDAAVVSDDSRVTVWPSGDEAVARALLDRAALFVYVPRSEGLGLPLLDAFAAGLPTVHSDVPSLVEISAGSGLVVERDGADHAERLGAALVDALADEELLARLRTTGLDRAQAFSWRDSAEKVWQLHADL